MNQTATTSTDEAVRAETALVAGLLRHPAAIADVATTLRQDHFSQAGLGTLYRVILELFDQGIPVDLVSVADYLHRKNLGKETGGYPKLSELWEIEVSGANVAYNASLVREHAILRGLVHAGNQIAKDASDRVGSADELLEAAEKQVFRLSEIGVDGSAVHINIPLAEAGDRIDAAKMKSGDGVNVPSGYLDLDDLTGGWHPSEFIVVAARPSVGKTALGICLAYHAAVREQMPVFFSSIEQSRVELAERLMCVHTGINSHLLRRGVVGREEMLRLSEAKDRISRAPMFIDDYSAQSMLRIGANVRRLKMRHGVKLLLVDYLQLVEPESRKEPRHEQVSAISRRLKRLAREVEIPIIAMAQLNRGVENRHDSEPRLSDLRESGGIEADADTVILLHRPADTEGVVHAILAKQRNGPTGTIPLAFVKHCMRFENYAAGA